MTGRRWASTPEKRLVAAIVGEAIHPGSELGSTQGKAAGSAHPHDTHVAGCWVLAGRLIGFWMRAPARSDRRWARAASFRRGKQSLAAFKGFRACLSPSGFRSWGSHPGHGACIARPVPYFHHHQMIVLWFHLISLGFAFI